MSFGNRLKLLRSKRGITQDDLASALDIPSSTIRRLETDITALPRRERLEAIADYFDVTVDYLLGREDLEEGKVSFLTDPEKQNLYNLIDELDDDEKNFVIDTIKRITKK